MADHDANAATTDVDLLKVSEERSIDVHVSAGERLRFARQVLLALGIGSAAAVAAYAIYPDNQALAGVFEFVKIGLLPLTTLVISFYFPKADR